MWVWGYLIYSDSKLFSRLWRMPLRKKVLPHFQIQLKRHSVDQNAVTSWPQEYAPTGVLVFCDLPAAGWGIIFPELAFGELQILKGNHLFSVISSFGDHKNLEKCQTSFSEFLHWTQDLKFYFLSNKFGLSSYTHYIGKSAFPKGWLCVRYSHSTRSSLHILYAFNIT